MDRPPRSIVEITWSVAFRIWVGVLWRLVVFAFFPSLLFASVLGGVVAFILVPSLAVLVWKAFVGLGTAVLSVGVCKWVLGNPIADFSVRLIGAAEQNPFPAEAENESVE